MRFQKKYLVLLISGFAVFPVNNALNCVESISTDQVRVVHFFKDIFEFNDLYPFIYETEHIYYSSNYHETELSEADWLNVRDWKLKLNDRQITDRDIISFLYELEPSTYWQHRDEWDHNNRFLNVTKNRYPEIYTYLQLIKEMEMQIGTASDHKWEYYDVKPKKSGEVFPLLEQLLVETNDPFLKRRFAYKLITFNYYVFRSLQGSSAKLLIRETSELFKTYFAGSEKDWLYYSALHYYSQISGKKELLLESYIYGKDKRARAAEILGREFLDKTIAADIDRKKVAACLAVRSLTNPGRNLENLEKIYEKDPGNRDLSFLVSREINKLEHWLWTEKISRFKFYESPFMYQGETPSYVINYKSDLAYSKEVAKFLNLACSDPQITEENKLFLSVAIAYIELLNGDTEAAQRTLEKNGDHYKNPRYRLQARVISLLLRMNIRGIDKDFEKDMLAILNEFKSGDLFDSPWLYFEQLVRTVAEYYKSIPELRAKGLLLSTRSGLVRSGAYFMDDIYENASVQDIDGMFAIIRKTKKTDFEHFITSGEAGWWYSYGLPHNITKGPEGWSANGMMEEVEKLTPLDTMRLIDFKGLKLMRQNKITEALAVYQNLSDSVLNTVPFSYIKDDVFIFRHRGKAEFFYNKKTFLQQLIKYRQALAINPNDALINFYVGNAYLNMTINGNAWPMMSRYISIDVSDAVYARTINHHYIYGDWAVPYFTKAIANARDPKLKVLAQINLAYIRNITVADKENKKQQLLKLCTGKEEEKLLLEVYSNCDIYYDYLDQFTRKGNRIAKGRKWDRYYYYYYN